MFWQGTISFSWASRMGFSSGCIEFTRVSSEIFCTIHGLIRDELYGWKRVESLGTLCPSTDDWCSTELDSSAFISWLKLPSYYDRLQPQKVELDLNFIGSGNLESPCGTNENYGWHDAHSMSLTYLAASGRWQVDLPLIKNERSSIDSAYWLIW